MNEHTRNYIPYVPPSPLNTLQVDSPGLHFGVNSVEGVQPRHWLEYCRCFWQPLFPTSRVAPRLAPPLITPPPGPPSLGPGVKNGAGPLSGGTSSRRRPRPPEGEVSRPNAPSLVRIRWRHVRRSPPSARRLGRLPRRHLPLAEPAAS